jgi:hypothetical protein
MKRTLLLDDAPADGGAPAPGAPPPAANAVIHSDAREGDAEEMVKLRRETAEAKRLLKEREVRLSELEDDLRTLKTPPAPAPAPAPRAKRDALTFFDPDEDEAPGAD